MNSKFVLGTQIYPAKGDAYERMCQAFDSWRELDVPLVNLAFTDSQSFNQAGFVESRVLKRDSNTVTGAPGNRKPLTIELFDGLCERAVQLGCKYFVFANADIQLTKHFRDIVNSTDQDSVIFSRLDYSTKPDLPDASLYFPGQDAFAVRVAWWQENRHFFTPYIVGEFIWDNVYTAKFARLGRSEMVYSANACLHQRHEQAWDPRSKFGVYNQRLRLRYDYVDFAMWNNYIGGIRKLDKKSADFGEKQKHLWNVLSTSKPPIWIKAKRLAAIPISYAIRSKRVYAMVRPFE